MFIAPTFTHTASFLYSHLFSFTMQMMYPPPQKKDTVKEIR